MLGLLLHPAEMRQCVICRWECCAHRIWAAQLAALLVNWGPRCGVPSTLLQEAEVVGSKGPSRDVWEVLHERHETTFQPSLSHHNSHVLVHLQE